MPAWHKEMYSLEEYTCNFFGCSCTGNVG